MDNELHELIKIAAQFFIKKYKEEGGKQSTLAKELGISQPYLSSISSGARSASLELYSKMAEKLYGPLDKFLEVGRRIKEGRDPFEEEKKPEEEDSVEKLIANLTYYVVDHKRIEKENIELKDFYETIVEKQQTGILVMDKDHTVIFANETMEAMSSIPPKLIIGTTPYNAGEKIPGLDISSFRDKYNEAFEGLKEVSYKNIQTKMPDGETVFISGSFYPQQENGVFKSMISTLYETTTSHILRNLLTETLNFSSHGIGIIQQTSPGVMPQIYFLNKSFRKIFGLPDFDPSKMPFSESHKLVAASMKNSEEWLDFMGKSIATNNPDQRFIIILKNNKKYEWVSNPLVDDKGHHWGRIATVEEIP